jgi:hypothetical protein
MHVDRVVNYFFRYFTRHSPMDRIRLYLLRRDGNASNSSSIFFFSISLRVTLYEGWSGAEKSRPRSGKGQHKDGERK